MNVNVNQGPIQQSTRWSDGSADTWDPYWDALFPPREVTAWIDWKRGSSGVNVARRFWAERENLRRAYESVHGSDPAAWPARHPGVVLSVVPTISHTACLGCQWFLRSGGSCNRHAEKSRFLLRS